MVVRVTRFSPADGASPSETPPRDGQWGLITSPDRQDRLRGSPAHYFRPTHAMAELGGQGARTAQFVAVTPCLLGASIEAGACSCLELPAEFLERCDDILALRNNID